MSATGPTTPGAPAGHRYHVVDGLGGWWLCETTDEFPEPTPIGLIDDLLAAAVAATPPAPDAERGGESGCAGLERGESCQHTDEQCPFDRPAPLAEPDTSAPEPVQTQETLAGLIGPTYRFCQSKALTAKARGLNDRPWLDVLLNLDALPKRIADAGWVSPADHARALTEAWDICVGQGVQRGLIEVEHSAELHRVNPFRKGDADD